MVFLELVLGQVSEGAGVCWIGRCAVCSRGSRRVGARQSWIWLRSNGCLRRAACRAAIPHPLLKIRVLLQAPLEFPGLRAAKEVHVTVDECFGPIPPLDFLQKSNLLIGKALPDGPRLNARYDSIRLNRFID